MKPLRKISAGLLICTLSLTMFIFSAYAQKPDSSDFGTGTGASAGTSDDISETNADTTTLPKIQTIKPGAETQSAAASALGENVTYSDELQNSAMNTFEDFVNLKLAAAEGWNTKGAAEQGIEDAKAKLLKENKLLIFSSYSSAVKSTDIQNALKDAINNENKKLEASGIELEPTQVGVIYSRIETTETTYVLFAVVKFDTICNTAKGDDTNKAAIQAVLTAAQYDEALEADARKFANYVANDVVVNAGTSINYNTYNALTGDYNKTLENKQVICVTEASDVAKAIGGKTVASFGFVTVNGAIICVVTY